MAIVKFKMQSLFDGYTYDTECRVVLSVKRTKLPVALKWQVRGSNKYVKFHLIDGSCDTRSQDEIESHLIEQVVIKKPTKKTDGFSSTKTAPNLVKLRAPYDDDYSYDMTTGVVYSFKSGTPRTLSWSPRKHVNLYVNGAAFRHSQQDIVENWLDTNNAVSVSNTTATDASDVDHAKIEFNDYIICSTKAKFSSYFTAGYPFETAMREFAEMCDGVDEASIRVFSPQTGAVHDIVSSKTVYVLR